MPGFDLDKNEGSGTEAIPSSQPVSRMSSFKSLRDDPKVDFEPGMTQTSSMNGYAAAEDESQKPEEEPPKNEEIKMVGVFEVFRFADVKDKIMMFFGTLFAAAHGAALPLMMIVFGEMTDMFINEAMMDSILDMMVYNCSQIIANCTKEDLLDNREEIIDELISLNQSDLVDELEQYFVDDMMDQMGQFAIYYAILGSCVIVLAYVQISFWLMSSYHQAQRIRKKLFAAILRQDISWFDTHEVGELNTRISDDVNKIQAGLGDKLGMFWQWFSAFITGFVIGFIYGWELTLVILAVSPLLAIAGAVMSMLGATMTSHELKAYAKAGAVAEEVFSSIRTVYAFGGQKKECSRYNANLLEARTQGIKKGMLNGVSMGLIYLIMFGSYALAFWYGSQLVRDNPNYTAGSLLIVFFSVLIGAFSIGNAAPNLQDFAMARGAAYVIYNIIDLEPEIDSSSTEGLQPDKLEGNIRFDNVVFRYPSRPEVTVLDGLNLSVSVGETVALVGASGCGKSTTVQLLQRFYDPQEGVVKIDDRDIRDYNVKWLRQQIGVVSQEPILFGTTIEENIRYGRDGVTQDEIDEAAIKANAHSFIMKLPRQYKTMVGERGAQLSGGQKQRIAIARALVRDPKILLLDEATSALDTESEASVQFALDTARLGRTTIVVAHRLSTIKTADLIAGFTDGKVVENGNHEALMKIGGVYHQLVTNQTSKEQETNEELEYDLPFERSTSVGKNEAAFKRTVSVSSDTRRERTTSVGSATEEEEDLPEASIRRIMKLNRPEWPFITMGCIAAIISGAIQPAFALIFAEILGVFSNLDKDEQESQINFYSGMLAVIGVIAGLAMFVMSYSFARSGEYLTQRLRENAFYSILRQEIAFYDEDKNNTGALCTRLSTEASAVQGATGVRLGTFFSSLASLGTGIIIGFVFSWKLTLVILAFAPFMLIAGFIEMKLFTGTFTAQKQGDAGKVAIEAIENIRTVATLTKEDKFYEDYSNHTDEPYKRSLKKSHMQGAAYGFSQAMMFYAYAACFSVGAYLIEKGELEYDDMFKVFGAIVFAAMSVGQASSFAPDYGKAKTAAARIFSLFDREPLMDSFSEEGQKLAKTEGCTELENVNFNYPNRPEVPVLRGITMTVKPGQMIALVGSSGCGKSTIVQLIERFYDPADGCVKLEDADLKDLHIQWHRSQMGIVSQEPMLFDCSIRENIAYGDNDRDIPMDEIIDAAKQANIHNFITELPEGYETNVGDKGTQLSGGQKQRVAIARALIRNPKILLLDEATSALDTESEKVVQEALDKAQEGRTSIVIAHRLSTIQGADCILVVHNGKIAEIGKHSQLIANRGLYYKLNNAQLSAT